ncbi:SixA phosphatase family protein [Winogradskyella bathintestinalis]|uniref:Phosphoglycerate mutase family protein n=1 Tax=Winogradskyella bathintestinalis TaxID=3035208 RepID=A0ABT7ZYA4_9FLAO|nr:phosphoglycerate mutase family protein [Winogradskyella bathintestinalis]MDN3493987.1 phosphoglycerate mutase family protein [Winogradskyella bathintestinalis]
MKKLFLILLIIFVNFSSCKEKTENKDSAVSTYYLIRHAEKDRTDHRNKNPDLTEAGLQRASHWAIYFKDVKFDAVYTTDYNRTKQTAKPTANANGLELQLYNPSVIKMEEFLNKTKGGTVLIVGHSNTTPKFVNNLLGQEKYKDIADDNNANLYVVTVTKTGKNSQLLVID